MQYSSLGIVAIIVLLIENMDLFVGRKGTPELPSWGIYRRFLLSVLTYYIADILWGLIEERKLMVPLYADTSLYFAAIAAGVLFWTQYVVTYCNEEESLFGRTIIWAGRIIAFLTWGLLLVNLFVPVVFWVDSDGTYHTAQFRYWLLGAQILLLIVLTFFGFLKLAWMRGDWNAARPYRILGLFGLFMTIFLYGQLLFVYLPLYSLAYLFGTCLLRISIIEKEKEQYSLELAEANKVTRLKQSISSLLDNMPALAFYKDAETGAYMACNQLFAEYVKREKPEDVVGLTDADIFPPEVAEHFVEDDKKALGMNVPLIFYEDVTDAAGNPRQFETVKQKFYDTEGRLCLLGMSVDVTEMERTKDAMKMYARLNALHGNMLSVYMVDVETEQYTLFTSGESKAELVVEKHGSNFFEAAREKSYSIIHPEDQEYFAEMVTRENVLSTIDQDGIFMIDYRWQMNGRASYVRMQAAIVDEGQNKILMVGIMDIDSQIRREQQFNNELLAARRMANVDALTGVKNKHSYGEWEEKINAHIQATDQEPFAVVVCDINDMKSVNDLYGHMEGDACIKRAAKRICHVFAHSPVFRIGGDEFAVILSGRDYRDRLQLLEQLQSEQETSGKARFGDVIAAGIADYRPEEHKNVLQVFELADRAMYERKRALKGQ